MQTLRSSVFAALFLAGASFSQAAILITQYYEGPSTNKWIEITNIGTTSIDLAASQMKLSLWSNAAAENYKTNGTPGNTYSLNGNLAAGASFVYGNSANTTPNNVPQTVAINSVINFNGNDSLALWTGENFTTSSIVDAIGFTDLGNEGADTSFVRLNCNVGWDANAGSNVLSFPSVWQEVDLTTVNSAAPSLDVMLGFSSIPESNTALLGILGLLGLMRRRR